MAEWGTFLGKLSFIAFLCDNLKILGRQVPSWLPWSYALDLGRYIVLHFFSDVLIMCYLRTESESNT